MGEPLDWVAFNRDHAFAIGDATPSIEAEFRSYPDTARVEIRTRGDAGRLHLAYLATLPEFAGLITDGERAR